MRIQDRDSIASDTGPKQSGREQVTLSRRSMGAQLRLATLSWLQEGEGLPAHSFLETIETASSHPGFGNVDLWLCAGRTLIERPSAAEVLLCSGGSSVCFEVWEEGVVSWLCAFRQRGIDVLTALRSGQIVYKRDDWHAFPTLTRALLAGDGLLQFEGLNLTLALLICGENNALDYLVKEFTSTRPWGILNPAHFAYWPQAIPTGAAKVKQVGKAG
ncbi:MAG TPA: hypothetical protein VF794_34825, partial [Archangium sp.]|uniref:hypothetical protein n=1 Tax=Archangium sp. TaxID=1872627 RepID=UPI002EDB360F